MQKKRDIAGAAQRLAAIAEKHLSELPPAEASARLRAFDKTVSRVGGSRAKSSGRPDAVRTQGSVLGRA